MSQKRNESPVLWAVCLVLAIGGPLYLLWDHFSSVGLVISDAKTPYCYDIAPAGDGIGMVASTSTACYMSAQAARTAGNSRDYCFDTQPVGDDKGWNAASNDGRGSVCYFGRDNEYKPTQTVTEHTDDVDYDAPFGRHAKGWPYCGTGRNKQPGTWDNLENYNVRDASGEALVVGCIVPDLASDDSDEPSADVSEGVDYDAPFGRHAKGWPYCGTGRNKQPGTWDNLENYNVRDASGETLVAGCIVPDTANGSSEDDDIGGTNSDVEVTFDGDLSAPFGRSPDNHPYCGPNTKEAGKWDDLRNYEVRDLSGDLIRGVSGGCVSTGEGFTGSNDGEDSEDSVTPETDGTGGGVVIPSTIPTADSLPSTLRDEYEIAFYDEFNGNSLDRRKWKTAFIWGADLTINNEEQYYVDTLGKDQTSSVSPFSFDGNNLTITAQKTPTNLLDQMNGKKYTSGIITSYDAFKFTYGYAEARVKIPKGQGLWPAFWLLNSYYVDKRPEIDIMENLGHNTNRVYQTYHHFDTAGKLISRESHVDERDYSSDFHTYAVEWKPGAIEFYIDGIKYNTINNDTVADQEMYVLANLAVGGNWPGAPDATTDFPEEYIIDYIRVFQKK